MFNMKHTIVKTIVIIAMMGGSAMPAFAASSASDTSIETTLLTEKAKFDKKRHKVKTSVRKTQSWTRKQVGNAQDSYHAVNNKVENFQDKVLPYGAKIKAAASPSKIPGFKKLRWTTENMSIPAILFIMLFGGVIALLGSSFTRTYESN